MTKLLKFLLALDLFIFVTFLVFKLLGIIAWAFIWIFAPIWIPALFLIVWFLLVIVVSEDVL